MKLTILGPMSLLQRVISASSMRAIPDTPAAGVILMTVAMLMASTLISACRVAGKEPPSF